ncbi:mono/diheme cytochrome c family protein [Pararhizobium capsulatum DSM 1112]|uniref:Mono/diheme cytochrome c family protein n=1 Tax=Pararhizobium capsulatum DSM 1112 TaxID=1121113 RepID=A0ABU0BWU9_9HYPH|nr:cytochrome c [Pararhizobium capsulatum]MDQ0322729.1 mono/diheme cytochrome c family protein [Pararhizobium capsulatum DSM 1112]
MARRPRLAALLGGGLALVAVSAQASDHSARFNYMLRCAGCHTETGEGLPHAGIPQFPGYIDAFAADDEGRTYMMHVPGVVGSSLSDAQIAAVLNYVVKSWGDPSIVAPFTAEEVTTRRAKPVPDVVAYRRQLVTRLKAEGAKIAEYPWP